MATLTHETLHESHEQVLSDGVNLSAYTVEIVDIFGGIDKILTDYLTKQPLIGLINKNQLHQLDEIISKHKSELKQISKHPIAISSQNENQDIEYTGIAPLLILDEKNTWLHSLFSPSVSEKIQFIISHKICTIIMSMLGVLAFVLRISFPTTATLYLYITLICFCFTPFITLVVLSANCVAAKLIMTSFEFLLKTYYVIIFFTSVIMLNALVSYDKTHVKKLEVAANAVTLPYFLLIIACIFNLDAYKIHKLVKIAMPTIFAVIFLVLWIQVTLLMYSYDKKDPSVITITKDIHISLNSQIQGASFILSIFCFKQTFMTILRHKAIAIKMVPRIKWKLYEESKSTAETTEIANYIEVNLENEPRFRNMEETDTSQIQEIKMHKITEVKKTHQHSDSLSMEL